MYSKGCCQKKNSIFVVIGHNGWEGHSPGPQYKIQTIVVTDKRMGRSKELNDYDQNSLKVTMDRIIMNKY